MKSTTAKLNYLKMAPRKVRSVADLVKGMSVNDAEAQLMAQRRRPAKALLKLLRSAVANAKNNKLDPGHLFIESFRVDGGPMLKRMLPRARGSASPIQKKMSNVTLVLGVNEALTAKYTIVVPKKVKSPSGEAKARPSKEKRAAPPKDDGNYFEPKKKQGLFKRMFSPKSRASK